MSNSYWDNPTTQNSPFQKSSRWFTLAPSSEDNQFKQELPRTPMSQQWSGFSGSEPTVSSPQRQVSFEQNTSTGSNNWIELLQNVAREKYNAEPLSPTFISQLDSLIWNERIVAGTPRLCDVLPYPYSAAFYEPNVQEARLQEAMSRHRATGLSWSALFQRIEYLCKFGFAELYCNTRQVTTLQVATFERAMDIVKANPSLTAISVTPNVPFTIRQLNSPGFQEALRTVGVSQGEGALRTFILAYSTVAYHTRTGIIEPVPQSMDEVTRRLRRTFILVPERGSLKVMHRGTIPHTAEEAQSRYQQAQRRSKNRQQGQLRSTVSRSRSSADDPKFDYSATATPEAYISEPPGVPDYESRRAPGPCRSAPERTLFQFRSSDGSSMEPSADAPRIPGSLVSPEGDVDMGGSQWLQTVPEQEQGAGVLGYASVGQNERPPGAPSTGIVSGIDARAYGTGMANLAYGSSSEGERSHPLSHHGNALSAHEHDAAASLASLTFQSSREEQPPSLPFRLGSYESSN